MRITDIWNVRQRRGFDKPPFKANDEEREEAARSESGQGGSIFIPQEEKQKGNL